METRRVFLRNAAAVGGAVAALQALTGCASSRGPVLAADPAGILDLPPGFSYAVLSRTGEEMSDGLLVPAAHDGMAAFPVASVATRLILVRNHENSPDESGKGGAFGEKFARLAKFDASLAYDRSSSGRPHLGGTTTLLVNVRTRRVERSHLSVAGTIRNCAGGPTPWGSWLTCEETTVKAGEGGQKDHGFIFEAPSQALRPVMAQPLTAMGRFNHEAAAVDPKTGVVYLTEDDKDGLFYRFLPNTPGELAKGGRLQALMIAGQPGVHTNNKGAAVAGARVRMPVRWVDLKDVHSPDGDLPQRGHAAGAARFARGEGLATAIEAQGVAIYFTCTSGGAAARGQIFRYVPSPREGQADEDRTPGTVELFVESRGEAHFDYPDNIVAAPWGDLVFCEDGDGDNYVRGVRADGQVYDIARNAMPEKSEFAGACFSPDGSTLFVNIQRPGMTLAIEGPWRTLRA